MIKDRIIQFIEFKGITKDRFYEKIGMTSANFRGKARETPINSTAIENILTEFPDLNLYWLVTGKGDMERKDGQINYAEGNGNIQNNIHGIGGDFHFSQNDMSNIIEIQRELNQIIKHSQTQLSECQKQVSNLIEIIKNK